MNHSVFRDLVPSYIENLTSEETNNEIEKHMEQCEDCRQYVKEMQEDLLVQHTDEKKKEEKGIDYFKKVRSKNRKKIFIIVGSLLSIFIGCFFFFDQMWIANEKNVQTSIKQQGTMVTLSFQTKNDNRYILPMSFRGQKYIYEIIIYEKWNDLSEPASIFKDGSPVTFTFLDANTLILDNGEEMKLTDEDKILIQYKNSTEEIRLKDLYDPEDKRK
ncbi:zf-HC2 domain-containing protein [Psychrobacillus sp. Sa2BUA9]|uniref:Zf-HC2 domain-containing protein n=1 Tax=Psychrobacillus faecigallinarum TaxID=2762235 RepID=A0ABR8RBB8_9BACI|nr:zf-HC2 domain-containing protein [Psychrobacillus faecigallinarum]MBD7945084.1 zf-HC2 domain-containing protein [Psychrobacillus faecigallinarum]